MEAFEGMGLYLQFVTKFWGNTHFLKLQSLCKVKLKVLQPSPLAGWELAGE